MPLLDLPLDIILLILDNIDYNTLKILRLTTASLHTAVDPRIFKNIKALGLCSNAISIFSSLISSNLARYVINLEIGASTILDANPAESKYWIGDGGLHDINNPKNKAIKAYNRKKKTLWSSYQRSLSELLKHAPISSITLSLNFGRLSKSSDSFPKAGAVIYWHTFYSMLIPLLSKNRELKILTISTMRVNGRQSYALSHWLQAYKNRIPTPTFPSLHTFNFLTKNVNAENSSLLPDFLSSNPKITTISLTKINNFHFPNTTNLRNISVSGVRLPECLPPLRSLITNSPHLHTINLSELRLIVHEHSFMFNDFPGSFFRDISALWRAIARLRLLTRFSVDTVMDFRVSKSYTDHEAVALWMKDNFEVEPLRELLVKVHERRAEAGMEGMDGMMTVEDAERVMMDNLTVNGRDVGVLWGSVEM